MLAQWISCAQCSLPPSLPLSLSLSLRARAPSSANDPVSGGFPRPVSGRHNPPPPAWRQSAAWRQGRWRGAKVSGRGAKGGRVAPGRRGAA